MSEAASDSASHPAAQRALSDPTSSHNLISKAALAAIAMLFGGQLWLVFNMNINWDEFYFLSHVYDHLRGTLSQPLQTMHVHLFQWLASLPVDEMGQITAGRLVMLACEIGTAGLIYGIARQFVEPMAALFGVLAFLASRWTLSYGMSFRTDPLAAFLLMSSLYVLIASSLRVWQLAIVAVCGALAVMVTIKSALYLPAFAGALVWRLQDPATRTRNAIRIGIAAVFGCACLAALHYWHSGQVNAETLAVSSNHARSSFLVTFTGQTFLPRELEVSIWALGSVLVLLLTVTGLMQKPWSRIVVLALFVAPLLSLLVYRNAYSYFFPYIIPPAMIAAAAGVTAAANRPIALAGLLAFLVLAPATEFAGAVKRSQTAQRETVAAVHAMFPEPVQYIDRSAMITSFPRSGFFMSTWGLAAYKRGGKPIFGDMLRTDKPVLLITNVSTLYAAMNNEPMKYPAGALFAKDAEVLRNNFIHHWGHIWVAGKQLEVSATPRQFDIVLDGVYTLEGEAGVELDGRSMAPGDKVDLAPGTHVISAAEPANVVLRWGNKLWRPDGEPSDEPVFFEF